MQATTAKDAFAPGHTRLSAHDAELVDQTLKEAIKVVENKVHFFEQEGLRKTNFVLGVMNLTLSAFIVGKWPEWYWVWYLFKALFMVVYKLLFIWYPRKEHYYFLDFCWVTNGLLFVMLTLLLLHVVPSTNEFFFLGFFSIANGPLAWASVALSNKLVFHNFEWTTTLFIHFSPAVASWGLHWFREESEKVWGTRFDLVADASAWDVFSAGWYYYIFWWVLFTTWMLTRGLYYPEKGYDTVFNALKKALKFDQAAPFKGKSLRMQIVIYMVGHFIACTLAFTFSILVWNSFWLHTLFINFCLVMSLVRGSSWYVYAMKNAAVKQIALLEESFEEAQHEDTQTGNQQKKDK